VRNDYHDKYTKKILAKRISIFVPARAKYPKMFGIAEMFLTFDGKGAFLPDLAPISD
jgi:hypothetical protein